jgi:hypothetical protein
MAFANCSASLGMTKATFSDSMEEDKRKEMLIFA